MCNTKNLESEKSNIGIDDEPKLIAPQAAPRVYKLVYKNFLTFGYWHIAGLYGLYLCFTTAKIQTVIFEFILFVLAEIGITAGVHRLWAHRAYKANLPLQLLLMVMYSISFQNSVIDWVRDHRLHHKYTDTDADPHNATRGFFYSHVGWLLVRKHPEVKKHGKRIDISDIVNNPILYFQKKYAIPWFGTVCYLLPTIIPYFCWNESLSVAWYLCMLRYAANLEVTFLINSAAHIYGYKPYNKDILPTNNIAASIATFGEGFHNYHHVFPWDYKASELNNRLFNWTTIFIDFFVKLGWAYELKSASDDMIRRTMKKNGDGTNLWGYGDADMTQEDLDTIDNNKTNN